MILWRSCTRITKCTRSPTTCVNRKAHVEHRSNSTRNFGVGAPTTRKIRKSTRGFHQLGNTQFKVPIKVFTRIWNEIAKGAPEQCAHKFEKTSTTSKQSKTLYFSSFHKLVFGYFAWQNCVYKVLERKFHEFHSSSCGSIFLNFRDILSKFPTFFKLPELRSLDAPKFN